MSKASQVELRIPVGDVHLFGNLAIPQECKGIVIFSHGSGSSRLSPRNQAVAQFLNAGNFGTLLFDLLTAEEDQNYNTRFDIELLTERLTGVTKWLKDLPGAKNYKLGYFGASTGAASALRSAADLKEVAAVVSRGGRPDMAKEFLPAVKAPTLLIVGSLDTEVLQLNRWALDQLTCTKELAIVNGATHLFEEEGTLDEVMHLSANWFEKYLH
ncbi:MAG TPA: dienelactone hydrolase family protein [Chitinophagaceae bacterium]|nr:dienelactone hydrolase family protein [Chitinophagaceae bacterium]